MAKSIHKRGRSAGPVSYYLEDKFLFNYEILGTPQWLAEFLEPDCVDAEQKISISEPGQLAAYKQWMDQQAMLGVDAEATGLNHRAPEFHTHILQVGTKKKVYVIDPRLIPEFKAQLESTANQKLGQNIVYDFKLLLHHYRVHLENMYCTMLTEQLLTSGLVGRGVSLMEIVRRHPPFCIISKEVRKQFLEHQGRFTREEIYYAARDVYMLFDVHDHQRSEIQALGMARVAQDEYNCIPCTAMMELGGVHLDRRVLALSLIYFRARAQYLEQLILTEYNREFLKTKGQRQLRLYSFWKEEFDLDSTSQKLAALRQIGIDLDDTKRDTLEQLDHPIAPLLIEYSEVMKVLSTYGDSLVERIDVASERLYPEFNQLGSGDTERMGKAKKGTISTGRYSSDFQQLPRPEKRFSEVTGEELDTVQQHFARQLAQLSEPHTAIDDLLLERVS